MKLNLLLASALVFGSLPLASSSRAADAPSVDSILAKYVTALGGKSAIEKVHSRMMKIQVESEQVPASSGEIYAKMPNKQSSQIELSGVGTINEGFDGKEAWAKSPWEGLRVKTGDELAKVKRDAEFHRDLKLKELYPGLAYKGTEKIGDEEVCVLECKPTATSKERLAFSTKTGLQLRQESEFEGPQGKVKVVILVQAHKEIEGLKYPSQMRMDYSMGDQAFQFNLKVVEAKLNPEIADVKFTKPGA